MPAGPPPAAHSPARSLPALSLRTASGTPSPHVPLPSRNVYVGTRCAFGVRTPDMHFAPTYTFGNVEPDVGYDEEAVEGLARSRLAG